MLPSLHRHAVRIKLVAGHYLTVLIHGLAPSGTPQPVAQEVAPLAGRALGHDHARQTPNIPCLTAPKVYPSIPPPGKRQEVLMRTKIDGRAVRPKCNPVQHPERRRRCYGAASR
jgi:hypothetical protein